MLTFENLLRRSRLRWPQREAVVCGDVRLDVAALVDRSLALAAALRSRGIGRGDRVAILSLNCHRAVEAYLGVPMSGAAIVPLNGRLAPPELAAILAESAPSLLLTDRPVGDLARFARDVVMLPDGYEDLVRHPADPAADAFDAPEDETALIAYTGGTSGVPKGAAHTQRGLLLSALAGAVEFDLTGSERWLLAAPLFHVAGLYPVLPAVVQGATLTVLGRFEPGAALDLVERERLSHATLVPVMLAAMAGGQLGQARDLASVRWLGVGGAPMEERILGTAARAFPGADITQVFGATELVFCTSSRWSQQLAGEWRLAAGRPAIGCEVRVVDTSGAPLGPGEIGELQVRTPWTFTGYWRKPDLSAARLTDGWYHTGDIGRVDAEGWVFLMDRVDDRIITGGENVYASEVETVLARHPAVVESAVIGVPSDQWGESVHAIVVTREPVSAPELEAHCRPVLAGYKVPRTYEFRAEPLPRTPAGKLLKRLLRAAATSTATSTGTIPSTGT